MKISQQLKNMENQVITLHTETVIDSAHQLKGYDGKCKAIHGHS
jgi:6-pyruvoyl-tetrahydropterin synthase